MLTEYCIKLPDEPGQMATLCEALAEKGVNLLTACALTATGAVVAIVTENPKSTMEVLDGFGHEYHTNDVLQISVPHKPGSLAAISRTMGNAGINISSLYIMAKDEDTAIIAFTVDDTEAAREMI